MKQMTRTLIVPVLLAAISGCSGEDASITDDGVYFGELTAANPQLEDGSHYATHTIALEAGETLDLTMQSTDFDAYLRVEDASGALVGEDDDSAGGSNANVIVVAPGRSIYTIFANSFSAGEFGEYMLAVRRTKPDGRDDVFTGVLPEVDGKSFNANSYPRHEITAAAGDVLDVHLTSGSFDAFVEITDASGDVIAEDDDGAGGTNSRLTLPIRSDGIYTVVVKSFSDSGSGPYTLTVRRDVSGDSNGSDQFEHFSGELTARNDRLDDGTPYAIYPIDAKAGEQLEIDLSSDSFDAYLQLWTDREVVVAEDDDSGGGLDSRLSFVVPADGRYLIVANSIGEDARGPYDIMLRRVSLDNQLAAGKMQILTGTLSTMNEAFADGTPTASHEIEARAGERLDIAMMAGNFDAYLLFFDASGTKLSEDDDSGGGTNARLSVIAPTDGTYRIVANSYDSGTGGPYTITVRRD